MTGTSTSAARPAPAQAEQRIACPALVLEKVRQFAEHIETYKDPSYSEAQLRIDFLNPMLEALGWDVQNTVGYAEAYRDVVYEDDVKIGGASKAPDYGFYIGGRAAGGGRKFFLEAKRPAVALRVDPKPAFQLRRYAWTAGLPLSILTDFEELLVFDTRLKPNEKDSATTAALVTLHFQDYPQRWHEIASVFSRDAILRGSFDKFAQATRKKKAEPLGEAFLSDIEEWRGKLARNIALHNQNLSSDELNFAVQRTIDRIIFLRICEDRGIEPPGTLMALLNGDKVYERLGQIFRGADDRYNSGIFYFTDRRRKPEPGRVEPPDDWTLDLNVDDKAVKEIIRGLYDPCPYQFSVMPPEILGQVYEQFLGKVIRLTAGGHAKVEEKPEVRKAGGVYYTPAYIVGYIVKNTVGRLLGDDLPLAPGSAGGSAGGSKGSDQTGRSPRENPPAEPGANGKKNARITPKDAAKLRIVDPASGSGSFLIGAYQYLLDWHLRWYLDHDPEAHCKGKSPPLMRVTSAEGRLRLRQGINGAGSPAKPHAANGGVDYRLTTAKRKEILLNSIYGVDIDPQAVEVTKLSLLLKVLEGESQASIDAQLRLLHNRALPDLGSNIKCFNSLIGSDFDDSALSADERKRINKYDWDKAFPEIFKRAGASQRAGASSPPSKAIASRDPQHGAEDGPARMPDAGGFDAVIGNPPYVNAWELFETMPSVREHINDRSHYTTADRHWDMYVIFIERSLSLLRSGGRLSFIIPFSYAIQKYASASRKLILETWSVESIADLRTVRVFGRVPVITIVPVIAKTQSPADHRIQIQRPSENSTRYECKGIIPAHFVSQKAMFNQHEHMWRLDLSQPVSEFVSKVRGRSFLLDEICYINYGAQMSSKVKGKFGKNHVIRDRRESKACKPMVSGRDVYRFAATWKGKYVDWSMADQMYGPRWPRFFETSKLMIRDITGTHRIEATLDTTKLYCDHTVLCAVRKFDVAGDREFAEEEVEKSRTYDLRYLCGIVASRVLSAYYYFVLTGEGVRTGGGFHTYPHTIRQFPIRVIDFSNKSEKAKHDRMVSLVERMVELHQQLAAAKSPHDQERLPREIEATDTQIDQLVYELYGLSDDEIRIIEVATERHQR